MSKFFEVTSLKDTTVYRGGSTAQHIPYETNKVNFHPQRSYNHEDRSNTGVLRFAFNISAAGGGETSLMVDVGEQDFSALLSAMIQLAPEGLLPQMANAFAQHMADLPKREAALVKKGREEVLNKARQNYVDAPFGNNEVEEFVHTRVEKLVRGLEPKPAVPAKPVINTAESK